MKEKNPGKNSSLVRTLEQELRSEGDCASLHGGGAYLDLRAAAGEKTAFIFCVDDRALFCQDCDEAIHIPDTRSANHQRLLATSIRVGSSSVQTTNMFNPRPEFPNSSPLAQAPKLPDKMQAPSPSILFPWEVDDFLHLPDHESSDKEAALAGFGELLWFSNIGAAEVPEMFFQQPSNEALSTPPSSKKPRIQLLDDDDFFTVPDLGVNYLQIAPPLSLEITFTTPGECSTVCLVVYETSCRCSQAPRPPENSDILTLLPAAAPTSSPLPLNSSSFYHIY
ncbi:Salt tolerance protein [Platanthera guangdongensis]|uniref:Salt tolerance protein n=1 Tax=Platanthera guangdongensis TaxID=2320717 RepID=A0ABR2LG64_9ASPA